MENRERDALEQELIALISSHSWGGIRKGFCTGIKADILARDIIKIIEKLQNHGKANDEN
jgi:hypothetical protein